MLVEKMDGFPVREHIIGYTLVHVGCDWVFKSNKGSSTDNHQEMNAPNFEL